MVVKIFVVSLARATERRRFMEAQLKKLNFKYEFVNAVDALNISEMEVESVNREAIYGRPLTRGEIACARSHAAACERVALDSDCEFGIVLEDDVIIGAALPAVIKQLLGRGRKSEVTLLYATPYREVEFSVSESLSSSYHVIRPSVLDEIFGMVAYFISKERAKALAEKIIPVKTIADDWKGYVDSGVFSALSVVFPFPVLHAEFLSVVRVEGALRQEGVRDKVKRFFYLNKIFPLYQIILAERRRKAEVIRRKNIVIPGFNFSKTYRL